MDDVIEWIFNHLWVPLLIACVMLLGSFLQISYRLGKKIEEKERANKTP